jgi:integrase
LTLLILAERARQAGQGTRELGPAWLQEQHDALRYERRKGFRRAIRFVNDLIAKRAAHPAIDALLPATALAMPVPERGRRVDPALLPASFHVDVEAFEQWYRWRGQNPRLARHQPDAGRRLASVKAYRSAISWLVRELVEGGIVEPGAVTGLAAICRFDLIEEAAIRFSARRAQEGSRLKRDAGSLHSYVAKCRLVATCYVGVPAEEAAQLKGLLTQGGVRTRDVARIAADREAFLRELARNARMRQAVLLLPATLQRAADALHARWGELRPGQRMRCLRLAMVAAQTAILLWTMAIRATNLRSLRFRGPGATLALPRRRGERPRLDIPASEVKNRRKLDADLTTRAEEVVRRWLVAYRPLLISAHPFGKNAVDSDFVFPGLLPDQPMDASTAGLAFAVGVEAVGLAMTAHACRHAIACLILQRDPGKIQMVADWLGDDPATVRQHYTFMDTQRAAELGQQHLEAMIEQARHADARQASRRGRA